MIWKYDTKQIGGVHYICISRLKSIKGEPDFILESDCAFANELIDANGKLQWVAEPNPDYDSNLGPTKENPFYLFLQRPQLFTAEEKEVFDKNTMAKKITELIDHSDLVMLLMDTWANNPEAWEKVDTLRQKINDFTVGSG